MSQTNPKTPFHSKENSQNKEKGLNFIGKYGIYDH